MKTKEYTEMDEQRIRTVDIVSSLIDAVNQAGGHFTTNMFSMTLERFITTIAAPNSIRFVCIQKNKEKE